MPALYRNCIYLLLWICLSSATAVAYFIIPYTLNTAPIRFGGPSQRYTVLVFLADHFDHNFGFNDTFLKSLMWQNHYANDDPLLDYLEIPGSWYADQLRAHSKIYGDVEGFIKHLSGLGPLSQSLASFVVITQPFKNQDQIGIDHPLTTIRVSCEDEHGLLPAEYSARILSKNSNLRFPRHSRGNWTYRDIPLLARLSGHSNIFGIQFPSPTKRVQWLEQETAEIKTFAMEPKKQRRLLRYLFAVGYVHKIFFYGSKRLPSQNRHIPSTGMPLANLDSSGVRIASLWSEAFVNSVAEIHREYGMEPTEFHYNYPWKTGETTQYLHASVNRFQTHVAAVMKRVPHPLLGTGSWLQYNPELAALLKNGLFEDRHGCPGRVAQAANAL